MDENFVPNLLSLTLFFVALFIALRAFYLYTRSRSRRIFILSVSMGVVSLTAIAGFAGDNVTSVSLNVDWFNYIGQTISFTFILFSFFSSSDSYLRGLMRWQLVVSALLLALMVLAPVLPPEFPAPTFTKTFLSGSRAVICNVIFFFYIAAFWKTETRYSLMMAFAFLLLSYGYLIILPKYFSPNDFLDRTGDITRVCGLLILFFSVVLPDVSYKRKESVVTNPTASYRIPNQA
ncbi:MAG TPA: hypothetical protein VKT25_06110 [Ktedonobacteraceae bacterium]|nr:hypothetical protein [Ktedonobacteraceae bacterium]